MFLFPVPVREVVVGAACRVARELESVHGVNARHLVEHFFRGDVPVVVINVVEPVGMNGELFAPVVASGIVAVVRTHHVDARVEHLRDKRLFGGVAFDLSVTHFVNVSPVQVRRNFLNARVCIDRDVDGESGGGCE